MQRNKSDIVSGIVEILLDNSSNKDLAKTIINEQYPHTVYNTKKRTYTISQKMEQFVKDGFIDRYTGQRLLNPGILKALSVYFPDEFPYHPHWKMTETHMAYWDLTPTIDHIYPIAKGGVDDSSNWVTTSMKNNSIKSNYTIDEIHWTIYPCGDVAVWDGLTNEFIKLVENDKSLLNDNYIKNWYCISKKQIV